MRSHLHNPICPANTLFSLAGRPSNGHKPIPSRPKHPSHCRHRTSTSNPAEPKSPHCLAVNLVHPPQRLAEFEELCMSSKTSPFLMLTMLSHGWFALKKHKSLLTKTRTPSPKYINVCCSSLAEHQHGRPPRSSKRLAERSKRELGR